jgi:hypothetical protein
MKNTGASREVYLRFPPRSNRYARNTLVYYRYNAKYGMPKLCIHNIFLTVGSPLIYHENFTNGDKHIMLILLHQFNMLKLDCYQIQIVLLKVSLFIRNPHLRCQHKSNKDTQHLCLSYSLQMESKPLQNKDQVYHNNIFFSTLYSIETHTINIHVPLLPNIE